jgi:hypothetical protein
MVLRPGMQVQPQAAGLVLVDVCGRNTDANPGRKVQYTVLVGKEAVRATARSRSNNGRKRDQDEEDARESLSYPL